MLLLLPKLHFCTLPLTYLLYFYCSVTQSCPTLCDPMDCSASGFRVLQYLPEFAQTRVRVVDYAIQPFHPLPPPSLPAFNLYQHQSLNQ